MGFFFSSAALGVLGGARHALEPDHLAAVCTLVAERPTLWDTTRYALSWSAGHSAVLALAGGAMLALRTQMTEAFSLSAERGVACLLILLGMRSLWRAFGRQAPTTHVTATPFGIGVLHGLAGSGAFTAWLAGASASVLGAAGVLCTYAVGMGLGMCAAALLARHAFVRLGGALQQRAMALSGLGSLGVGIWWLCVT